MAVRHLQQQLKQAEAKVQELQVWPSADCDVSVGPFPPELSHIQSLTKHYDRHIHPHQRLSATVWGQEEKRQLRQDACQLAEAQHEALLHAKAHVEDLQADKTTVAGIISELKAALEQSVQSRDDLQGAVSSLQALEPELTATR